MSTAEGQNLEYYSVALIGSSGGGTATLGHTDPVELLTAIHRELLRIRDDGVTDDGQGRRVCVGLSHAIFVSLCDGSGFDSVGEKDWMPSEEVCGGPTAALYAVGFSERPIEQLQPFQIILVDKGPLTRINLLAQKLDVQLSSIIGGNQSTNDNEATSRIAAMISLSSEATTIHCKSLRACNNKQSDFPIVGSGGTSLSKIASLYDLRIVGNSGGSVASTTLTKAKGWAIGLAREWSLQYDANYEPEGLWTSDINAQKSETPSKTKAVPTLKSILEAALPSFLFVAIAMHFIHVWDRQTDGEACTWNEINEHNDHTSTFVLKYALQHIVLGTTCSMMAASSYSNDSTGDHSTLLMVSYVS